MAESSDKPPAAPTQQQSVVEPEPEPEAEPGTQQAEQAAAAGGNAPTVPQVHVEAESLEGSDTDSAVGDDLESYTTSLKSTVLNYRYENGRRYHGFKDDGAKYFFPNDDEENDRLDLYHHIQTLRLDGELHLAPIGQDPQRILDIGTGTGIWAIDMGDKYPSAEVLGNDISPIQPSLVPPNVKFEVDDLEDEWVYSSKFDLIHARYLACAIRDWPKLMAQAYKYTKPGGWVEFQDFDCSFYSSAGSDYTPDSPFAQWVEKTTSGLRKFGVETDPGPKIEGWVKDAGFVNVEVKVLPMPIGPWAKDKTLKEIGAFNLIQLLDNIEGMTLRIMETAWGWSAAEIKVFCAQVRAQLKNPRLRLQHNYYVVYGQKGEDVVD